MHAKPAASQPMTRTAIELVRRAVPTTRSLARSVRRVSSGTVNVRNGDVASPEKRRSRSPPRMRGPEQATNQMPPLVSTVRLALSAPVELRCLMVS